MSYQAFVLLLVLLYLVFLRRDEFASFVVVMELFHSRNCLLALLGVVRTVEVDDEVGNSLSFEGLGTLNRTVVRLSLPVRNAQHTVYGLAAAGALEGADTDLEADSAGEVLELLGVLDETLGVEFLQLLLFHEV